MRIISGSAKGRRLFGPGSEKGRMSSIRPTSDKVRESIFNIVGPESVVDNVLDLFAGTGALGIEALSRGAGFATFVDNNRKAIRLIHKNLDLCGFNDHSAVFQKDIGRGLGFLIKAKPTISYDLVLCDPPYHMALTLKLLEELDEKGMVVKEGMVLVEDANEVVFPNKIGGLSLIDNRRYGDTSIWIYQNK